MKLDQRREELRGELTRLVSVISEYHLSCPPSRIENPFIQELEVQMRRKTSELDALNALANSPLFRFREACCEVKLIIWTMAIGMCVAALFFGPLLVGGSFAAVFAVCAVLSLVWAVWSSRTPDF